MRALRAVVRRLRRSGPTPYLYGLWLRRHGTRAGIVTVDGGGPLPRIEPRGGRLEIENCAL